MYIYGCVERASRFTMDIDLMGVPGAGLRGASANGQSK